MRPISFRPVALALCAAVLTATACRDTIVPPTAPAGPPSSRSVQPAGPVDLDTRILSLADSIFPHGLGNAFDARWTNVKRQLIADPNGTLSDGRKGPAAAARKMELELVQWVQSKTGDLTPPAGETNAHVAARLVLYMSLYVFSGPSAQPPTLAPGGDAALGIVTPAAADTLQTPTLHAGVAFPAGSVSEATVVVVTQESTVYPDNCSGPLNTHLCQYPQFYRFNVFPDVRLSSPATVAVCHVNSGSNRVPPSGIHDRFRLAHDRPVNPADYITGGAIVDSIEILPLVFSPTLIDCTTNDRYALATHVPQPTGFLGGVLSHGLSAAARVASAVGRVIAPKNAYAIDQGGGGLVDIFSNFAVVDPLGTPDLKPAAGFNVGPLEVMAGDAVTVNAWTIANVGTATAGAFTSRLVIATDTALSQNAVPLGTAVSTSQLIMGASVSVPQQTIALPATLAPGTYFVGAVVDNGNAIAETDESNDYTSVRITVAPPLNPHFAIATGDKFTCGLTAVGAAYCWGANGGGQLGNGTTVASSSPVAVTDVGPAPLRFTRISASGSTACGVTRDSAAYCWGANAGGQLGNGTTVSSSIPVAVAGGLSFRDIAVGGTFACGLTVTGSAYCWGKNALGVLAVGDTITLHATPSAVVGGLTFQSITASLFGACAITTGGSGYCWGNNVDASFGVGTTRGVLHTPTTILGGLTFTQLEAGAAFGCGLAGTWQCWGTNFFGDLGNGTTSSAAANSPAPIAGSVSFAFVAPGKGNDIETPTCGLTPSGAAYCWGANEHNQLGTSAPLSNCSFGPPTSPTHFTCTGTPVPVNGSGTYTSLRIGTEHVCAIATTHEFVCWGWNDVGQLGSAVALGGSTATPTVVAGGLRAP